MNTSHGQYCKFDADLFDLFFAIQYDNLPRSTSPSAQQRRKISSEPWYEQIAEFAIAQLYRAKLG